MDSIFATAFRRKAGPDTTEPAIDVPHSKLAVLLFAHYGLPPSDGYLDWYERFGQDIADQLDSAVGGFGTWAILFSMATLAPLCVVGRQIVMSLRARRSR